MSNYDKPLKSVYWIVDEQYSSITAKDGLTLPHPARQGGKGRRCASGEADV